VFGPIDPDLSFRCQRLPQAGETLLCEQLLVLPGGKGADQARAAQRMR
jgi:ribokinase